MDWALQPDQRCAAAPDGTDFCPNSPRWQPKPSTHLTWRVGKVDSVSARLARLVRYRGHPACDQTARKPESVVHRRYVRHLM